MCCFKVAATAVGVLMAFLVVSSVIGFFVEAVIAALVERRWDGRVVGPDASFVRVRIPAWTVLRPCNT
jgi:hypothetical protein